MQPHDPAPGALGQPAGPVSRMGRAGFHLRRSEENTQDVADLLAANGGAVGLTGVLGALNRQTTTTRVPGRAAREGLRWQDDDEASKRWWPQGISTSADSSDAETVRGPWAADDRRMVVVSWYWKKRKGDPAGQHRGSRITFLDLESGRYRHVLLVEPRRDHHGRVRMHPVVVHAGGLVWVGPYLHVAGTRQGLVSARLDDVVRVRDPSETFGYPYVLPVLFSYEAGADPGTEGLRYSFVSLDRSTTPPAVVAGEYGVGEQTRRLVHYSLEPETLHLSTDDTGLCHPVLHEPGVGNMQGAVVVDGTWYVTRSHGSKHRGTAYVGRPGHLRPRQWALPPGPEDICYWPSTQELWSVSEHPGQRWVYPMPRSWWDRALF